MNKTTKNDTLTPDKQNTTPHEIYSRAVNHLFSPFYHVPLRATRLETHFSIATYRIQIPQATPPPQRGTGIADVFFFPRLEKNTLEGTRETHRPALMTRGRPQTHAPISSPYFGSS